MYLQQVACGGRLCWAGPRPLRRLTVAPRLQNGRGRKGELSRPLSVLRPVNLPVPSAALPVTCTAPKCPSALPSA